MIVVATADFDLCHEAVSESRSRGATFTAVEPGDSLPERTRILLTGSDDDLDGTGSGRNVARVAATSDDVRRTVDEALAGLHDDGGQTIVGVDPEARPDVAVLSGKTVVATFHIPLANAIEIIREETDDVVDPVVRIGGGARSRDAKLVSELDGVAVELVDETGTTPYLGNGTRNMSGVLATVNIARRGDEHIGSREIEPTKDELTRIKARSREASEDNRTINGDLTRRIAGGELSIGEALDEHCSCRG